MSILLFLVIYLVSQIIKKKQTRCMFGHTQFRILHLLINVRQIYNF